MASVRPTGRVSNWHRVANTTLLRDQGRGRRAQQPTPVPGRRHL
jgi:hypothetical protein